MGNVSSEMNVKHNDLPVIWLEAANLEKLPVVKSHKYLIILRNYLNLILQVSLTLVTERCVLAEFNIMKL